MFFYFVKKRFTSILSIIVVTLFSFQGTIFEILISLSAHCAAINLLRLPPALHSPMCLHVTLASPTIAPLRFAISQRHAHVCVRVCKQTLKTCTIHLSMSMLHVKEYMLSIATAILYYHNHLHLSTLFLNFFHFFLLSPHFPPSCVSLLYFILYIMSQLVYSNTKFSFKKTKIYIDIKRICVIIKS